MNKSTSAVDRWSQANPQDSSCSPRFFSRSPVRKGEREMVPTYALLTMYWCHTIRTRPLFETIFPYIYSSDPSIRILEVDIILSMKYVLVSYDTNSSSVRNYFPLYILVGSQYSHTWSRYYVKYALKKQLWDQKHISNLIFASLGVILQSRVLQGVYMWI